MYVLSEFNSKETFSPLHTHQLELDYVRNQRDDHGPCHVLVESINPVKATYQVATAIAQTQAVQQRLNFAFLSLFIIRSIGSRAYGCRFVLRQLERVLRLPVSRS